MAPARPQVPFFEDRVPPGGVAVGATADVQVGVAAPAPPTHPAPPGGGSNSASGVVARHTTAIGGLVPERA